MKLMMFDLMHNRLRKNQRGVALVEQSLLLAIVLVILLLSAAHPGHEGAKSFLTVGAKIAAVNYDGGSEIGIEYGNSGCSGICD